MAPSFNFWRPRCNLVLTVFELIFNMNPCLQVYFFSDVRHALRNVTKRIGRTTIIDDLTTGFIIRSVMVFDAIGIWSTI